MNICVYCSSSDVVDDIYFEATKELGKIIGKNGDTLIYGGGDVGLMGALARCVHNSGGKVIGVIPEKLKEKEGVCYEACDELIVTETMNHRKAIMAERADAFIALPGGFGTYEEILEVLTLKQLRYHNKPIVFINTNGFYSLLMQAFGKLYEEKFAKPECRNEYYIAADGADAIEYIMNYKPTEIDDKWFKID